jgi:AraC family transcriptional regulator
MQHELDAGHLIARWVGFEPDAAWSGLGRSKTAIYRWRGTKDESDFGDIDQLTVISHTGGARKVPVRAGPRCGEHVTRPGCISVLPPRTPVTWEIMGEVHSYSLHFDQGSFDRLIDRDAADLIEQIRFCCGQEDMLMTSLIEALAQEVENPSEIGPLYADTLADSIALGLIQMSRAREPARSIGGLSGRTLARVIDRIEARLEEGVSLQELAEETGLSRAYFSKAFRQSTGDSPHQYLIKRRLDRARERLESSADPICDIALDCGFSSQAHFTEAFRRRTGHTPHAYRARFC